MKTTKIFAALLSAAAMSALPATAAAAEEIGYVTFYADKNVIGQGLVTEPVLVPIYEGDSGIDIAQRAAQVQVEGGDWGSYITGFADNDTGAEIPAEIMAVCPEMHGRNTEGWLCAYDYTAESGWNWFLNGESAAVGISDYVPADGDVMQFRFTVYGFGSDLGIDNSSWGGSPALVEQVDTSELARLAAAADKASDEYIGAVQLLGSFGVSQQQIDEACAAFAQENGGSDEGASSDEGSNSSPDTGIGGAAAAVGLAAFATAVLLCARREEN